MYDPTKGPPDPFAPFLAGLAAKMRQAPMQQAVLHRTPSAFGPAPVAALAPFFSELFGLPQMPGLSDTQTEGTVAPGGTAVDLTDPKVNPGEEAMGKMTPLEQFVRKSRMLAAAMRGSPGRLGIPGTSGIQRALAEGELNPANEHEKMLVGLAPMIAAMGILAPIGATGGVEAAAGKSGLVMQRSKNAGVGGAVNAG